MRDILYGTCSYSPTTTGKATRCPPSASRSTGESQSPGRPAAGQRPSPTRGRPAVRTIVTAVRDHTLETLAILMLTLNLASIVVSLVSGDARLLFAREAAVSSVVALWALGTLALHQTPLFEPGFEAFITRGERRRTEIWQRLRSCDPEVGACCDATRWSGASSSSPTVADGSSSH